MKRQIGSALLSCAMAAALLGGCAMTVSPAEPTATSESTAQPRETEQTLPDRQTSSESMASSQEAQPTETPSSSMKPAGQSLSEEAEWELFSRFWQEACIGNLLNKPCGEDFSVFQPSYWKMSSLYLENKAEAAGETPPRDANGVAYFPMDDYLGTLQAMFGEGQDYRSSLPDEPGPEAGTLLVCSGYDLGYVVADLDTDSFSLGDNTISVDATLLWREAGYTEEMGCLHYEIGVQPENPYCRYRFLSITGDEWPSQSSAS